MDAREPGLDVQFGSPDPARLHHAGAIGLPRAPARQRSPVKTRDAFNNTTNVTSATTVNLTAVPATGFTFYSNATCGTAVTSVVIAANTSNQTFYVKGTTVGTVAVTAASPGLTSANQNVTVTAGNPAQIVFVTSPLTMAAGACSAVATVELRDAFNNPAPAAGATVLGLAAAPPTGFAFHANATCTSPTTTATVLAGATRVSFYLRGTSAGAIVVTVSGAGLTSANQTQTVTAGAATHFQWATISSPQSLNTAFGVSVTALDAFGNLAPTFTSTAALTMAPAGTLACTSNCTNATTTGTFSAGAWSGTVTLTGAAAGNNRTLTATQGTTNGTSNAFTVSGPASRTPPYARFTWSPAVVVAGGTVNFDASTSTDYQTPTPQLQVTWDPTNTGNNIPWTPWTTTKTYSFRYNQPGLYRVRMAVRDSDGDIDYRSGWVQVLRNNDPRCTVNTNSMTDDGATNCTGNSGPDGKLSLPEAIRLSNASGTPPNITFSTTMTITGTGRIDITTDANIYAQPGVILAGVGLRVLNNSTVFIYGLEMSNQTQSFDITGTNPQVTFTDMYIHDMPGVNIASGNLTAEQCSFAACTGPCIQKTSATAGSITLRYSMLRSSPGQTAVSIAACPNAGTVLDMFSNTVSGFATGVSSACNGPMLIRENTFDGLATGVSYSGGTGQVLEDNIFSNSTTTAATCGTATFTTRSYQELFNNASNGCVNGDPNQLTSDPTYAFASAGDYRLAFGSPAIDSAFDTGLDVCLGFPGNYEGGGPDRGGRESY